MKIIFDLTALDERPTGIARVAEAVAKAYISNYPENKYVLLFNKKIPNRFPIKESFDNVEVVLFHSRNKILRLFTLPKYIKDNDADFILCCAFPGPLLLNDKRVVSIIHDLNPWKFPKTMKMYNRVTWRLLIKHALKTNSLILNDSCTISEEIKKEFGCGRLCPIPLGVDTSAKEDDRILEKFDLSSDNYILSVSTLEPRKNLKLLLNAFSKLKNNFSTRLVLTGAAGWKLEDAIGSISDDLKSRIVFTGYVSDEELKSLYVNAKFFVSTSVYEGFGLPLIEAVKNNLPIIVSDIPVYKEITANKAIYFKSNDEYSLIEVLEKSLGKNKLRETEEFKELRNVATTYNWDAYVSKLNKILEEEKNKL